MRFVGIYNGGVKRICVFCGSNVGARPEYRRGAEELGRLMLERKIGLVYGGGNIGLMGVVADTVLAGGGEVQGVIPRALVAREVAHAKLSKLHIVESMHERKQLMADLSDAFVALPGGYGTFEEFCEAVTWSQLGIHKKPCGLLNVEGYFDHLIGLFDHAVQERFLHPDNRALVLEARTPAEMLEKLAAWQPTAVEKWIEGRDR
jgi:uncharacterized protein (TIGR00730 family)